MEPQQEQKPTKGGYGKRPWWQWALIYVVVAVVVYFVVYWLFFRHTGTTPATSGY